MTSRWRLTRWCAATTVCLLIAAQTCAAYSVLTHEEIIDLLWDQQIKPLLLVRFPDATPDDLIQAHAYAYGGSVIQDVGYYPFGSHLFSDLTHYVRTGDFVQAMLADSENLNEYAFALGALSHYVADINGHPYINRSVGIDYPKLAREYGPEVPYDVDHKAHLRTLERAFYDTYGIKLTAVMPHEDLAIGTYRRGVSQVIPEMTKVALAAKGDELQREIPDFSRKAFLYHLSEADYRKSWGTGYERPGFGARLLAFFFKILPKVGPLRDLDFKEPTPKTEDLYFKSVDQTFGHFRIELTAVKNQDLQRPNIDLDTGKPTARGEYPLADATYRELLAKLASDHFEHTDEALRQNVLGFFDHGGDVGQESRIDRCNTECWRKTWVEVNQLRSATLLDSFDRAQPQQQPSKVTAITKVGSITSGPGQNAARQ